MDRIKTSELARGRWPKILRALRIPANVLNGKHGPCVFCGGKDRARFANYKDSGSYYCNQCGSYGGFKFLMKYHGWSFKQTADKIDKLLATNAYVSSVPSKRIKRASLPEGSSPELAILMDESIPTDQAMEMVSDLQWIRRSESKSVRDATLWLKQYVPERLEAWLDAHPPELREWLENEQAT
jgi:hypothetical protein